MKKLFSLIWPMSIRLQLTCWYTSVLAAMILGAGSLVYTHLESSLETTLDGALALRVQQISTEIREQNNQITIEDSTGNIPSSAVNSNKRFRSCCGYECYLYRTHIGRAWACVACYTCFSSFTSAGSQFSATIARTILARHNHGQR